MKYSRDRNAARAVVFGVVAVALGLVSARAVAGPVGPELPRWMASLVVVDLYDYPVRCEPRLEPAEVHEAYGNRVFACELPADVNNPPMARVYDYHRGDWYVDVDDDCYVEGEAGSPYAESYGTSDIPPRDECLYDDFDYDYSYSRLKQVEQSGEPDIGEVSELRHMMDDRGSEWQGQMVDLRDGSPETLLTTEDRAVLRRLGQRSTDDQIDGSEAARRTVLNDYLESLGWEALKLTSRFEEASEINTLDLTEDLPMLAAVLATFRQTERGNLSTDEAVDSLCHDAGELPQSWSDLVDGIVSGNDQELPDDAGQTMPVSDEAALPAGGEATLIRSLGEGVVEIWHQYDAAFRNIMRQIGDTGRMTIHLGRNVEQASRIPPTPWYHEVY